MEESSRSIRPSTALASERQREIDEQREEIAQLKRKSARLKQIVKQEEAEFVQAAVRFARLVSSGRY